MNLEMIIFDLDGTLWDTEDMTYKNMNKYIKQHKNLKEIDREIICKTMGSTFEETAECCMPYLEKNDRERILGEMLLFNSEVLAKEGGKIYPNLKEILKRLRNKYKIAIVSNCADGYIESFLESSKLGKYFDDFAAAAKMKVTKAEAIQRVMKRNKITKAIYVGDTIKDFEASKGAGIGFIQAKYGFGEDLGTKYAVDNIKELPEILNDIESNGKADNTINISFKSYTFMMILMFLLIILIIF